jgi:hypothetical protein
MRFLVFKSVSGVKGSFRTPVDVDTHVALLVTGGNWISHAAARRRNEYTSSFPALEFSAASLRRCVRNPLAVTVLTREVSIASGSSPGLTRHHLGVRETE